MGSRFLVSFVATLLATLVVLGGIGYAVTRITVGPPREAFRAGSFEFDLAPGWWCELDNQAYSCTPPGKPPYTATVLMVVKERSSNDTLRAYEDHLKEPKKDSVGGSGAPSVVRYVRRSKLGDREWVEALHTGSEIASYDTYYLATTTSLLGILVTMSVHRDHRAAYAQQLRDMMGTLNVYQR
jgi:hypothetical protein